jgi:hypothetical protein
VLPLIFHDKTSQKKSLTLHQLIVAGWTGRDSKTVAHHIEELKALGVKPPSRTPLFYLCSILRVTLADTIEVLGPRTSGEAEFLLLKHAGALWVGIGSDHTDRDLEAYGVAASKQICDKPIGGEFWRYDELAPHWDRLRLRAYAVNAGKRELYQEGSVAAMLSPTDLISIYGGNLPEGALMFCGTLAAIGGIRPAERFECEIDDPVLKRRIGCGYDVVQLPIVN